MSDTYTYTYEITREVELDIDWIIRKTESLAKANPNADFWALVRDAIVEYANYAYSDARGYELDGLIDSTLDSIVDDIFWDRKDDFGKIAKKYSNTCTLF